MLVNRIHRAGSMPTTAAGILVAVLAALMPGWAIAETALNMPVGVTEISREVYDLHMTIFYVCCAIAVVVFGAIIFSIIFHRKSRGAKAAQFHHSTTVEIVWTIVPFVILIAMALPAAKTLVKMENTKDAEMNLLITGYQWKWKYDFIDSGVSYYSSLAAESNRARQKNAELPLEENYLLEVDNELVLPVDTKVRLLITAADVIHAWWVPDFAVKKDAIPGFVNETWVKIDEPGVYRGQCAELCGRDHGFMPIVVRALPKDEFQQWLAGKGGNVEAANQTAATESVTSAPVAAAQPASQTTDAAPVATPIATPAVFTEEPAENDSNSMEAAMVLGEQMYNIHCAACHNANGEGMAGVFPALKGSAMVMNDDPSQHIDNVMNGKPGTAMAAFAGRLSDAEMAAVITYERNAWGNNTGQHVTAADIAAARK